MKFAEEILVTVVYVYLMLAYTADVVQTLNIVAVPSKPSATQAVQLTCTIGASFSGSGTGSASWIYSLTTIATCTSTGICSPDTARYSFTSNTVSIAVAISSYDENLDSFDWTCKFGSSNTSYSLKKDDTGSSPQTSLSPGAIAGIVIAGVLGVGGRIILIWLIIKYLIQNHSPSPGIIVGMVIASVLVVAVDVAIIAIIILIIKHHCHDVKNKTVETNNSGNRNPAKKPNETHTAIHKTPNNANSEANKPFDQSERRPLPQGPLPSLHPRNVNQPLDGEQQNFEEPKKKKKKLKMKQKDEGTTEEGKEE